MDRYYRTVKGAKIRVMIVVQLLREREMTKKKTIMTSRVVTRWSFMRTSSTIQMQRRSLDLV